MYSEPVHNHVKHVQTGCHTHSSAPPCEYVVVAAPNRCGHLLDCAWHVVENSHTQQHSEATTVTRKTDRTPDVLSILSHLHARWRKPSTLLVERAAQAACSTSGSTHTSKPIHQNQSTGFTTSELHVVFHLRVSGATDAAGWSCGRPKATAYMWCKSAYNRFYDATRSRALAEQNDKTRTQTRARHKHGSDDVHRRTRTWEGFKTQKPTRQGASASKRSWRAARGVHTQNV